MSLQKPNVTFDGKDRPVAYMGKLNAIAAAIDLAIDGFNQQLAAANDANLHAQNAQSSASAAASSASTATTRANQAASSATAAATSATNASNSATAAATSSNNAATSASNASSSATAAASSATAANGSATSAATSASTATTRANQAETARAAAVTAKDAAEAAAQAAQDFAGGNFVSNNDTRLSDAREWTADTVSQPEAEAGAATTRRAWTAQRIRQAILAVFSARSINSGTGLSGGGNLSANRTLSVDYGSAAGTACQGNDARLSDAREWSAETVGQAEAEAGTAQTRRAWTAQRIAQAITAIGNVLFISAAGASTADCNTITVNGFYKIGGTAANCFPEYRSGDSLIHCAWSSTYAMQIGGSRFQRFWVRYNFNGVWGTWQELLTAQNFGPQHLPRQYINANTSLQEGFEYHVNGNRTLTLPTGSPIGTKIRLTKSSSDTVTINRGGTELIRHPDVGTDTQVIFNIHSEIIFVKRTSTEWEV